MAMTETAHHLHPSAAAPLRPPTDVALIAAFAALIAACAVVGGIPVGGAGVDITLQTFGVLLAGCVLGPIRGFLAVTLYLGLGAVGLPVFAGHTAGLAVLHRSLGRLPDLLPVRRRSRRLPRQYVGGELRDPRARTSSSPRCRRHGAQPRCAGSSG